MSREQLLALLPILITSATIVWVMVAICIRRHHWWNATVVATGLNLALIAATWLVLPQLANDLPEFLQPILRPLLNIFDSTSVLPQSVTPLLVIDGYSAFYMGLVLASGLATATLAYAYMEGYKGNREEMYILLALSVLGGLVVVCTRHFAAFFIGLELQSLPLYGMIGYLVKERRSLEASMKYLVLSAMATAFILFGMALVYSQTGTLLFTEIGQRAADIVGPSRVMLLVGGGMILVGAGFKLSLAPFHLWTPDVYEGTPAPVAAYLATASKTAIIAMLLRYFVEAKAYQYAGLMDVLSVIAVASIVIGNVLALLQDNIKRLLAYSSIAHFGYILVAFIASGALAVEAVGFYLLTYVVTTLAAFGVVTLMSSPYVDHDADALWDYRGLFWRRPNLSAILTVAMLSLAGIPLTAGFIGKFYVIAAGVDKRQWVLLAALVFGSAVGLFYYLRAMAQLYLRAPWARKFAAPLNWAQGTGGLMLLALMVWMLVLGVVPSPFIAVVRAAGLGGQ